MHRRGNRVANALAALGVREGGRVAILLHNRLEYLDLWFGLSRIGALQVPINTEYKAAQILQTLQRAPVALIVAEASLVEQLAMAFDAVGHVPVTLLIDKREVMPALPRSLASALDYAEIIAEADEEDREHCNDVSGASAAAIMSTSGTTGPSKGVLLSHAQQYILGRNIAADMSLSANDVYYNYFPMFHNTSQAMIAMPALLSGARMVLTQRFSASRFWNEAHELGCTAFYYIGEILRILLRAPAPPEASDTSLRVGWGIGAAQADFQEFQARFGVRLRTGYGSTEANVPCFLPSSGVKPGSAGRALPEFEIRIANPFGEPVEPGVHGEILVRSTEPCALMLGYDADPVATVAAWCDLWFHSGDAGYLDADGDLFFTSRLKDVIRVRGENVSAFEVESVIAAAEGVLEVAAIAVPCELGGDDVKVFVVPREGVRVEPDAIVAWARDRLPRFAVPRYVELLAALPKTPTNKVQKHLLREMSLTGRI